MLEKIVCILGVGISVFCTECFSEEIGLEKSIVEEAFDVSIQFQDEILSAPFLTAEDKHALKEMVYFLATESREEITSHFDKMEVFLGKWDQLDSKTKVKCIFFMCLDPEIGAHVKTLLLDPSKALIVFMIIDGAKDLIMEMISLYEFEGWLTSTIKLLDLDESTVTRYMGQNSYFELLRYVVLFEK